MGDKIRSELDRIFLRNAWSDAVKINFQLPFLKNKRRTITVSLFLEDRRKRSGNNLYKVTKFVSKYV
jgi:hypothetical protein